MNDKTKTASAATGPILFRVNYSFINKSNGAIRNGSIAVNATSAEEAKKTAQERLATFDIDNPKVTGAKPY